MLCELAHAFPARIAELLERDRGLKRNFREESVTDLLMASLIGLEPLGVRVDFPDEPTTGGDMEWIFAAPREINGGRYLRVILQAKRAQFAKLKKGGYWYYHHLDHGTPFGQQAQTLMSYATALGGAAALPLYVFYHPTSVLTPANGALPAVAGINLVFAHHVAPVVKGGCARSKKKVDYWRDRFFPLSDILCWPVEIIARSDLTGPDVTQFILGGLQSGLPGLTGGYHPDIVVERLRRRQEQQSSDARYRYDSVEVQPTDGIPQGILRAIEERVSRRDRKELKRPRIIMWTHLTRTDPAFEQARGLSRR